MVSFKRVFQNPHVIYVTTRVNSFTIFLLSLFYCRQNLCQVNRQFFLRTSIPLPILQIGILTTLFTVKINSTSVTTEVMSSIPVHARCTRYKLCDKVCQWLATCRWFSPGTQVSSINKTDQHDVTEILLKVALNTIILTHPGYPFGVFKLFLKLLLSNLSAYNMDELTCSKCRIRLLFQTLMRPDVCLFRSNTINI